MPIQPIWLASYPRSGNTFLRTILYQCFGLKTASYYASDLDGNKELESYVGHIEHDDDNQIRFPKGALPLVKTHDAPPDDGPAIYVVRDGRAASVSLWEFLDRRLPLEAVIAGEHSFGTWSDHVSKWTPWTREKTLLLKYEETVNDLPATLKKVSGFLGVGIANWEMPDRDSIASVGGKWVRKKSDWREAMNDEQLDVFHRLNGQMMKRLGYGPDRT